MKKILSLILFSVLFSASFGQYHLSETGVTLGAGTGIPLGYENMAVSGGWNVNAFFTHFRHEKWYGYHADLGFRNFMANGKAGLVYPPVVMEENSRFRFSYIDAGFYFKARLKAFHRPHEMALLIGPKVNVLTGRKMIIDGRAFSITNDDFRTVFPFQPGMHLSLWIKRKLFNQSWYLQPGAEYYFIPQLKTTAGKMSQLYLFINVGFSIWNTKYLGFK